MRYVHFLAKVGDADCRAKLESFQQDVLRRREEMLPFLDGVVGVAFTYADRFIVPFEYAYSQAATQLGWSRFPANHLRGLLRYPGENTPDVYVSFPVMEPFDMRGMLQVEHWVRNHGKRMLFICGENDPYSAPERALALERLFTWMGMRVPSAEIQARQDSPRMIGRASDRTLLTRPVSTPRAQPWDAQTQEPHDEPVHPSDF